MISIHDERIQKYLTPYKYTRPVLTGSGIKGAFDEQAVDIPFVFWHDGLYHMRYTGFDGTGYQSALAVSDDLLNWKHKGMVLTRDLDSGRWDGMTRETRKRELEIGIGQIGRASCRERV